MDTDSDAQAVVHPPSAPEFFNFPRLVPSSEKISRTLIFPLALVDASINPKDIPQVRHQLGLIYASSLQHLMSHTTHKNVFADAPTIEEAFEIASREFFGAPIAGEQIASLVAEGTDTVAKITQLNRGKSCNVYMPFSHLLKVYSGDMDFLTFCCLSAIRSIIGKKNYSFIGNDFLFERMRGFTKSGFADQFKPMKIGKDKLNRIIRVLTDNRYIARIQPTYHGKWLYSTRYNHEARLWEVYKESIARKYGARKSAKQNNLNGQDWVREQKKGRGVIASPANMQTTTPKTKNELQLHLGKSLIPQSSVTASNFHMYAYRVEVEHVTYLIPHPKSTTVEYKLRELEVSWEYLRY